MFSNRHPALAVLLMILAVLFALLALLLPAPARASTIATPDLRPCLTKSQATTKSPSKHLYYRTNTVGQKCWTGGKVGAREAYAVRGAPQSVQEPRKAPAPVAAPNYLEMENNAYLALCGQNCPWLEPFNNRWRLK